ncbi:MAG: NAD(P)-dependent oxidoreductase [Chloroflexi bacterium]|nr:NAD(P)-dependent oxidoreductase [Chloroflexota bacterium]
MTAAPRRTVLVTGATGYIASQMLPTFRERYDVRLIDVRDTDRAGNPVQGAQVVDLLHVGKMDMVDPDLTPSKSDSFYG